MRHLIQNSLLRKQFRALNHASQTYESTHSAEIIESKQITKFNHVWKHCLTSIDFYKDWQREHNLPTEISSPSDLAEFPVLTKEIVSERQEQIFESRPLGQYYSTGGSSGEPTKFPASTHETISRWADVYTARSWWSIEPTDKLLLIWGHSHLFGSGWQGRINHFIRKFKDTLMNTLRVDGYLASEELARAHIATILKYKPQYIVGYSSALCRVAFSVSNHAKYKLAALGLKGIIATSETLSVLEATQLSETFSCPVIVEYGAAELGLIAHSRVSTWHMEVLWNSLLVMASSQGEIRASTLCDRRFPLINYDVGDIGRVRESTPGGSVVSFAEILGRKQDVVTFSTVSGKALSISAIKPIHILKSHSAVRSVQFGQNSDHSVTLYVDLAQDSALLDVERFFALEMLKDHSDFDKGSAKFKRVPDRQLSLAGKHPLFRIGHVDESA